MAATVRRGTPLFITPWMCVRHRSKINFRKPQPRHLERRIFEAVTRPIVPTIHVNKKVCPKLDAGKVDEENRYEQFLIRRCKEIFQDHDIVTVFQRIPMSVRQQVEISNKLCKKGFKVRISNNSVSKSAIKDTKWENLTPLFKAHNFLVYSNDGNLTDLVSTTKSMKGIELIGGVVENRLMSRADILHYAAKPSIELLRGELVSILGSAASKTHRLLNSHQQTLSANLTQYVKQSTDDANQA